MTLKNTFLTSVIQGMLFNTGTFILPKCPMLIFINCYPLKTL